LVNGGENVKHFFAVAQNCRCTTIDIIDGERPALRTGRDPVTNENTTFDWKNFDDWSKDHGLTKNVYGEIYTK